MTSKETIRKVIEGIIMDVCETTTNDINPERPIIDTAGDSIHLLEIMARVEECFNVQLNPDQMAQVITVNDFVNYVHEHQESATNE